MVFNNIKALRVDRDISQATIAKYLGIAQNTYSQYESGVRQIPIDTLVKLCKFYNTSVDYIIGLTNEKRPYPRK